MVVWGVGYLFVWLVVWLVGVGAGEGAGEVEGEGEGRLGCLGREGKVGWLVVWEGTGREGKGREGKGREGKGECKEGERRCYDTCSKDKQYPKE